MFDLKEELTERGGTLLVTEDGGSMMAYLPLDENRHLEVSFCPENYPALRINVIHKTQLEIAKHIQKEFAHWFAKTCHISYNSPSSSLKLASSGRVLEEGEFERTATKEG